MNKAKPGRRLATISTAADYLTVSEDTVRRMIAKGQLTGYRIGPRSLRVDLNEADELVRPIPTVVRNG